MGSEIVKGASLRQRIRDGQRVIGTFIKTPTPHVAEIVGLAGLDFAVADMEHGPIGLSDLDGLSLGARSVGLPLLFRSAGREASAIWPGLDLGCIGVMTPHVESADQADALVCAVKYHRGARGFSPSGRAGLYGTEGAGPYRARADAETVIMAQIEDRAALANLDAIATTPDIDVLFVGPADLSLSLGCAMTAPELDDAIMATIKAARAAGIAAGLFLGNPDQVAKWADAGATVFVVGSDQSLLLAGAREVMRASS